MKGDEKVRWDETDDGYSIFKQPRLYEFAVMDSYGDMVTSGVIASNSEDRTNQVQHFLSSVPKHIKYMQHKFRCRSRFGKYIKVKEAAQGLSLQ